MYKNINRLTTAIKNESVLSFDNKIPYEMVLNARKQPTHDPI